VQNTVQSFSCGQEKPLCSCSAMKRLSLKGRFCGRGGKRAELSFSRRDHSCRAGVLGRIPWREWTRAVSHKCLANKAVSHKPRVKRQLFLHPFDGI